MKTPPEAVDFRVRRHIDEVALAHGRPPLLAETAENLHASARDVRESFQRLAAGRVLVLQPESGEILMEVTIANGSLQRAEGLPQAYYGPDRRDPASRRKTLDETKAVFAELGLTSSFWNLRPPKTEG
jgi:hypothetical protein